MSRFLLLCVAFLAFSCTFVSVCGDEDDEHCNNDNWRHCIGRTGHCRCFQSPNKHRNTVEQRVLQEIITLSLALQFEEVSPFLDPNIVLTVPGFNAVFTGIPTVISYLTLANPNIADMYSVLSEEATLVLQEGTVVIEQTHSIYNNVQTGVTFPADILTIFNFTDKHQIISWDIRPDTLLFATMLGSTVDLNITAVCVRIQAECTGALQQYATVQDCIEFMESIPTYTVPGVPEPVGNSVACRSIHEVLARVNPQIHCMHTGTQKISPDTTPCQNFS